VFFLRIKNLGYIFSMFHAAWNIQILESGFYGHLFLNPGAGDRSKVIILGTKSFGRKGRVEIIDDI